MKSVGWLVVVGVALGGIVPVARAQPCVGFTDVAASSAFCESVEWIRNRGVTLGCGPGQYCPDQFVDRLQMAAFMARLGVVLTPDRLFVDANPGFIHIQASSNNYVCASAPYLVPATASYPRRAVAHGLVWGLVDAAVVWNADVWYSSDMGATWAFMSHFIPFNAATASGATQGSTFGYVDLAPIAPPNDTSYVFAIRVRESVDGPNGTGNFTDLACHLMVEIGNRNVINTAPLDVGAVRAVGGELGRNRFR